MATQDTQGAEREQAEAPEALVKKFDVDEPKPKRTRKAKAKAPEAPKPEPVEEDRNAFQWPKAASVVLLDYLTARVSAEFDPEHPARPYINSNGKLFVHSTDWRDWLLEQGLAPSKSEAAKPLRDNVGVVRATPLPGMDKALGFYQGPALPGTDRKSVV